MLFDFMRRSSTTHRTEKVWVSRDYKHRGICREIAEAKRVRAVVVVVAFFRRTWTDLADRLTRERIPFSSHQETLSAEALLALFNRTPEGGVGLVLAEAASDVALGQISHTPVPAVPRQIIAAEHYPLQARDKALVEAAARLPFPNRLTFHSALDEPLFQRFGGERIVPLLKSLGMPEDDCIEHEAVGKALANAQKAVGKAVRSEIPADSAEHWFAQNLRPAGG